MALLILLLYHAICRQMKTNSCFDENERLFGFKRTDILNGTNVRFFEVLLLNS